MQVDEDLAGFTPSLSAQELLQYLLLEEARLLRCVRRYLPLSRNAPWPCAITRGRRSLP